MSNIQANALLPHHLQLLTGSAISPEAIATRGYRSVQTRAELRRLGFSENQTRVPALLIPIWGVRGEIVLYQTRPDEPRICHGKPVKYETPRAARMVVDVPPGASEWLADPIRPLFVTEGVRKADAAVSRGLCCIGLLGVWNWRGSNSLGGKTALADWEHIALNERQTFIAFDSDVMQKVEVHAALVRLRVFLESRGAKVAVIYLPPGQDASKVGLDDYFVAGHTVEELLSLAEPDVRPVTRDTEAASEETPYRIEGGRICFLKKTPDGPVSVPLCNFTAQVTEEVVLDDGRETSRAFIVEGSLGSGKALPAIRVSADRFDGMGWITGSWGLEPVPAAGQGSKDRLREAIHLLSRGAKRRLVFTHTGWREIDGAWHYLTASGGVGVDGLEVDLGPELSRYCLPQRPECPAEAIRGSLRLLKVAPLAVTVPLWGGVFRAPLASVYPLDLALWLDGITGSLKSTLAALFLCHWGTFDRLCLPGAWNSTANSLEHRAFVLKDALFVVDDYAPSAFDRRELETKAARLLRAQGNLAGRGRLRADLAERPTHPPRGLILGTGEELPPGQSIRARMMVISVVREDIDLGLLTSAQASASELPHALAGYVSWLAPQMGELPSELRTAFEKMRARTLDGARHFRVPEALAHLWIGVDCGLKYAAEIGAISDPEAAELRAQCWEALLARAKTQGHLVEEERPTRRYLQILATLVTQQRAAMLPKDVAAESFHGQAALVGWQDADYLYLIPDAAFQAVSRFAREANEPFPVGRMRVQQDLVREGVSLADKGHTTASPRVGGCNQRVLRLRRSAVDAVLGQEFPRPSPVVTGVTGSEE